MTRVTLAYLRRHFRLGVVIIAGLALTGLGIATTDRWQSADDTVAPTAGDAFAVAGRVVGPDTVFRPVVTEIVEDRTGDPRAVPGTVVSRTEVTMAFQVLGRMTLRPVDLGDQVRAGDVLAALATDDLQASTRAARAALDAAEVQDETARATAGRTAALADRNVATSAELERAERSAAAAGAALAQARAEVLRAEDAERFAQMTAPFAGVISAVYETVGAVVGAGAPILQLSALDRREAVIDLPEAALAGLSPGDAFTVWQRITSDIRVPAQLERIETLADAATRTRRLHLTLPADAPFRLGALILARQEAADSPTASLPQAALFLRDGRPHVWRVTRRGTDAARSASGQVTAVPVQPSGGDQARVRIIRGLRAGDEVVVRGVHSLRDGQSVGKREQP